MSDINREIAEKVMNVSFCSCVLTPQCFLDNYVGVRQVENNVHRVCGKDVQPKPYSTNIADAWLVVERMRELGFVLDLEQVASGKWTAWFSFLSTPHIEAENTAETAPMAICLAALEAINQRRVCG